MRNYKLKPVQDNGSGIARIGNVSVEATWEFDGLQRFVEGLAKGAGSTWVPNGFDYGAYTIWFESSPEGMPEVGTTTSLMLDDKKIGGDATWWVITYLASNGKIGIELSNRPSR